MTYPIPPNALDDRLAIVGTAGSGKTYLTLGAIEHLLTRKSRVIGVDPLGVMWGLRLCADGKTPSPFQPVIFGGAHGDLPINEHAGAIIGQAVATMRESCIIDLSTLGTKNAERRFMLAFLTALYRDTNREPVHLIVDEADMFAPQKLLDKEGDAAKLLGMMETVVRRGRVRGFIPWLLTQRPAVLSKDVLSQTDGVVALKLTAVQDRKALGGWVESTADQGQWKKIDAALPTFGQGRGVIWIPERDILETVTFPAKATFDSSRTPKRGEKREARELQPLDLTALKDRLGEVEAEAIANDPRKLKAEIAKLTAEIGKLSKAALEPPPLDTSIRKSLHADGFLLGFEEGKCLTRDAALTAVASILKMAAEAGLAFASFERIFKSAILEISPPEAIHAEIMRGGTTLTTKPLLGARETGIEVGMVSVKPDVKRASQRGIAVGHFTSDQSNAPKKSGGAEIRILRVLAMRNPARFSMAQWATLAQMKRTGGTWGTYVSRLRQAGYLDERSDGMFGVTAEGFEAAKPFAKTTSISLIEQWKAALGTGPAKMIDALCVAFPEGLTRGNLADQVGMAAAGGTFGTYLSRLNSNGLTDIKHGIIYLSDVLFK